jgi:hypothetical protein
VTDGILDRRYRVYRASHVALYSSFCVDSAPDPRTDKRVIRSTATFVRIPLPNI